MIYRLVGQITQPPPLLGQHALPFDQLPAVRDYPPPPNYMPPAMQQYIQAPPQTQLPAHQPQPVAAEVEVKCGCLDECKNVQHTLQLDFVDTVHRQQQKLQMQLDTQQLTLQVLQDSVQQLQQQMQQQMQQQPAIQQAHLVQQQQVQRDIQRLQETLYQQQQLLQHAQRELQLVQQMKEQVQQSEPLQEPQQQRQPRGTDTETPSDCLPHSVAAQVRWPHGKWQVSPVLQEAQCRQHAEEHPKQQQQQQPRRQRLDGALRHQPAWALASDALRHPEARSLQGTPPKACQPHLQAGSAEPLQVCLPATAEPTCRPAEPATTRWPAEPWLGRDRRETARRRVVPRAPPPGHPGPAE